MALLAAALFGATTPLAKGLLQDTSSQLLAGLLYLGSGAGLLIAWLGRRTGTLMYGLVHAPASSASLLLNIAATRLDFSHVVGP